MLVGTGTLGLRRPSQASFPLACCIGASGKSCFLPASWPSCGKSKRDGLGPADPLPPSYLLLPSFLNPMLHEAGGGTPEGGSGNFLTLQAPTTPTCLSCLTSTQPAAVHWPVWVRALRLQGP